MGKPENLVIVESPSKAKTIGKYLGDDYVVKASMGHLRDLPKSTMGVDLEHDFTPHYIPVRGKESLIKELKTDAEKAKTVYLATDPDREGEAISWHLKELLNLPDGKAQRVTFNEITQKVVKESIRHPRDIDYDLVDAQQARRILDRIVGYELSPLLWKKIRRGLSAGRVQSVATRLVVDRENEIRAFQPKEYWSLDVTLNRVGKPGSFVAHYWGEEKKRELENEAQTQAIIDDVKDGPFTITNVKKAEKKRTAAPPFTTSTLQQEAARKLGYSVSQTMMIAQRLYESGLITYMRTDSTRISDEMIAQVRPYIETVYGEEYLPPKPNVFAKSKKAQDAHEAIRPTSLEFPPDALTSVLSRDQLRLYTLIWNRFIASQMAPQIQMTITALLGSGRCTLRASGSHVLFNGFTIMQPAKEKKGDGEENASLPPLKKGEKVTHVKTEAEQHFTTPPPRYTEASLIKTMEEKGIGRPSTYAPILDTIQKRKYVVKEGKQFVPTEIGFKVTNLLKKYFEGIINVDFTANLENWLDKIADGHATYKKVMTDFYKVFDKELEAANSQADKEKQESQEVTDVKCEKCGANMIVKMGRYGKYLACPNYPSCRNIKPYSVLQGPEEVSDVKCDHCGTLMVYREGPYGRYLKCPKCNANKAIVVDTGITCPKCHEGHMVQRKTRRGRTFYGCSRYPQCDMALWNEPVDQFCPTCGSIMVKKTYKNGKELIFCSNPDCPTNPKKKKGKEKETKE